MIPTEDLIADLQRVAREQGRGTELTYQLYGRYAHTTVLHRFHRWNEALRAAGLPPGQPGRPAGKPRTEAELARDGRRSVTCLCLKCDKPFPSTNVRSNKICWECKRTDAWQQGAA